MANLWRVLAIAWLGGVASPILAGEPGALGEVPFAPVIAESSIETPATGLEPTQQDADRSDDAVANDGNDAG